MSDVLMVYLNVLTETVTQKRVMIKSFCELKLSERVVVVMYLSSKAEMKYTVSYILQVSLCGSA